MINFSEHFGATDEQKRSIESKKRIDLGTSIGKTAQVTSLIFAIIFGSLTIIFYNHTFWMIFFLLFFLITVFNILTLVQAELVGDELIFKKLFGVKKTISVTSIISIRLRRLNKRNYVSVRYKEGAKTKNIWLKKRGKYSKLIRSDSNYEHLLKYAKDYYTHLK